MPQEATDRKPLKHHQGTVPPPPPEQEHLPCPRCDSTNTKFCYYNNYNLSQPRHFCKSCRRYWTHGGTLRDIPVGGGSRKSAKRSRTSAAGTDIQHALPATPVIYPVPATVYSGGHPCGGSEGKGGLGLCGSFTSLLNSNGPGFLALSGFGLGIGPAFDDVPFGLGKGSGTVWPFHGIGEGGSAAVSGGFVGADGLASPWQFEGGDQSGLIPGDCFTWSDLAISTPGNGLK